MFRGPAAPGVRRRKIGGQLPLPHRENLGCLNKPHIPQVAFQAEGNTKAACRHLGGCLDIADQSGAMGGYPCLPQQLIGILTQALVVVL